LKQDRAERLIAALAGGEDQLQRPAESKDTEGLDFVDREAMRRAAIAELPDIARNALPDGDEREFVVGVRAEGGEVFVPLWFGVPVGWLREASGAGTKKFTSGSGGEPPMSVNPQET
jgi:hypothetical protein